MMKRFTQLSFFSTALLLGLIIASCSGSDRQDYSKRGAEQWR